MMEPAFSNKLVETTRCCTYIYRPYVRSGTPVEMDCGGGESGKPDCNQAESEYRQIWTSSQEKRRKTRFANNTGRSDCIE